MGIPSIQTKTVLFIWCVFSCGLLSLHALSQASKSQISNLLMLVPPHISALRSILRSLIRGHGSRATQMLRSVSELSASPPPETQHQDFHPQQIITQYPESDQGYKYNEGTAYNPYMFVDFRPAQSWDEVKELVAGLGTGLNERHVSAAFYQLKRIRARPPDEGVRWLVEKAMAVKPGHYNCKSATLVLLGCGHLQHFDKVCG